LSGRFQSIGFRSCIIAAFALGTTLFCQAAEDAASGGGESGSSGSGRRAVPATLRVAKERYKVLLLGRRDGKLLYSYAGGAQNAVAAIDEDDIQSVRMKVDYDRQELAKHVRKQDWSKAGALLFRAVYPISPFLALKDNNMLPLALRAANYMMAAGAVKCDGGWTQAQRAKAEKEYRAAGVILASVSRATWSDRSIEARLKGVICLVMLDRVDKAAEMLDATEVPYPADANHGLYRLARARVLSARGKYLDGIEEAVQSLVFETKDLGTFPDALLLSAYCYEGLEEWYRARDVYYEVARLFQKTHWGDFAEGKLRGIMMAGHTSKAEKAKIENVFFGMDEDVNVKANALLGIMPEEQSEKKEKDAK